MVPNPRNFCGGAFDDWLEVNLTDECNGHCPWCVERDGFHPKEHAAAGVLADLILADRAENVILLGGEPMLYPDIRELVHAIRDRKSVYITTNGTNFRPEFIARNIDGITGVNVSIHHYGLLDSQEVTGIALSERVLQSAVVECRRRGIGVRFNCNIIRGYIDTRKQVMWYLAWAKEQGVWRVRFAELKQDPDRFVSLCRIMGGRYGLNENPFIEGCNKEAEIAGVHVSFRQMCGLQTNQRRKPVCPIAPHNKRVLYYDGKFYDGWQTSQRM